MKFCDQPPLNNGHNNGHVSSHNFVPENHNEGPITTPAPPQPMDMDQSHPQPPEHQLHSQPQIIPTPETNDDPPSAADTAPVTSLPLPGIMKSRVKPEN